MSSTQNTAKTDCKQASVHTGRYLVGIMLMWLSISAVADTHPRESLRQSVIDFLHTQITKNADQDVEISVGSIDRRLNLTLCHTSPATFLAPGAKLQGKLTVGVRCAGPKPWTVYVPAQIKIFAEVISAAQPLVRGRKITSTDVITVRQELSQLHNGYFTNSEGVIGKVVTQNIASGRAITPKRIKAPILVHRGEKVTIVASMGTLKVRGKGEALRDAARGELITVRNSRSKRIIQGIAVKPGTVHVQM